MASKGILKGIRDFESSIEKSLENAETVRVDLFEIRDDEKDFFLTHYRRKYDIRVESEFDAPDSSLVPHYFAVIRRKQ